MPMNTPVEPSTIRPRNPNVDGNPGDGAQPMDTPVADGNTRNTATGTDQTDSGVDDDDALAGEAVDGQDDEEDSEPETRPDSNAH